MRVNAPGAPPTSGARSTKYPISFVTPSAHDTCTRPDGSGVATTDVAVPTVTFGTCSVAAFSVNRPTVWSPLFGSSVHVTVIVCPGDVAAYTSVYTPSTCVLFALVI